MMTTRTRYPYLAPDGDAGAAGGAVAAPPAAAAPASAAAPAAAPAPAAGVPVVTAVPTALAAGAVEPEDDPTKPWAPPEKYRVMREDGTLDAEATARKVDGARRSLEMRLGSGDVRPKTPDDYTIVPPEEFKETFKADDPTLAEFRAGAHKAGLSQKQLDFVMGKYFEIAPRLVGGAVALDQQAATNELKTTWPTDASYRQNTGNAFRAVQQLGGDLAEAMEAKYGNDPLFIQFAARVGAQLREDTPVSAAATTRGVDINQLLAHPAYSDQYHAEHASITAKVNAYYASRPGANIPLS